MLDTYPFRLPAQPREIGALRSLSHAEVEGEGVPPLACWRWKLCSSRYVCQTGWVLAHVVHVCEHCGRSIQPP